MTPAVVNHDAVDLAGRLIEQAQVLLAGEAHRALGVDDYATVSDLAARTGKHRATVRRWITEHGLPAKKLPGTGGYMIRWGDWLSWNDGDDENRRALESVSRRLAN